MLKTEKTSVYGFDGAIRGMRNPMNSWDKSDSREVILNEDDVEFGYEPNREFQIGPNDHELMMRLAKGGPVHAKYRRMIVVYADITAPLYWWKEFDTYKVGTVANSCSTMHKIHAKVFTHEDFSIEYLFDDDDEMFAGLSSIHRTIADLNTAREKFLKTQDKKWWWQMIQLLPTSYNQRRTVMLNYEALANIYHSRRNHKLDEWKELCNWIEGLPYSEIITGKRDEIES